MNAVSKKRLGLTAEALIALIVLAVFLKLNLLPILNQEFDIDETITYWVSKDSVSDALSRSYNFQNHTSLYFLYTNSLQKLVPTSEWTLRALNIPFGFLTVYFIFKFANRLFGKFTGYCACSLVLFSDQFLYAVFFYRPYIFCLFFLALSLFFISRGGKSRLILAGFSWGLSAACNIIYVASLPLMVFSLWSVKEKKVFDVEFRRSLTKFLFGALFSLLIGLPNIVAALLRRDNLIVVNESTILELVQDVGFSRFNAILAFILLGGFINLLINIESQKKRLREAFDLQFLVVLLFVLASAPISKFILQTVFDAPMNVDRYWLWIVVPQAILVGYLINLLIEPRYMRPVVLATIAVCFLVSRNNSFNYVDLRTGTRLMNDALARYPSCEAYIQSPVVESAYPESFNAEEYGDYLSAILSFYPLIRAYTVVGLDGEPFVIPRSDCSILMAYDWDVRHVLKEPLKNTSTAWMLAVEKLNQKCEIVDKFSTIRILHCISKSQV